MTDRLIETFTAPTAHRVDALLRPSDLLGERAQAVFAACAGTMHLRGAIAEFGVADGQTARGLCEIGLAFGKAVLLLDAFDTIPLAARNNLAAVAVATHARPVAEVRATVGAQLFDAICDVHIGLFKDATLEEPLAFVHADGDLYESTCDIIAFADKLVVRGGVVVFDDYGTEWTGVTKAVDERLSSDRWWTYVVAGVGQLVAVRKAA